MAEKSSSLGTTQVTVAAISLVGVVTAALFTNWDKVFPHAAATAPRIETQSAAPAIAPIAPQPAAVSPVVVVPDIAGTWRDDDGSYVFDQRGAEYSYRYLQNGAEVGTGSGRIEGRHIHHAFAGADSGSCDGEIAADARAISGNCTSGPNSFAFRITK